MLTRVSHGASLLTRIVELKGRLALYTAKQASKVIIGYACAAALTVAAVIGLLCAAYLALIPYLGYAGALAALSGAGLGCALVVLLVTRNYAGKSTPAIPDSELREEIDVKKEQLRETIGISDKDDHSQSGSHYSSNGSAHFESKIDPKLIAAAGIAAAGFLGPLRIFRSIRFAAALASTAALVNKAVQQNSNGNGHNRNLHNHP